MYRFQSNREAVATDNVLLSQLKWPIETIFLGMRPTANIATTNTNQYRDWHRMTLLTDNVIDVNARSYAAAVIDDTVAWNAVGTKVKTAFSQVSAERLTFPTYTQTMDTIQLTAHGINIFNTFKTAFFRDYMPYVFGSTNINTPEDFGAVMLNFALYPGTYQPSGHINVSRAREFYFQFVSTYITSTNTADLLVLAIAINFLLIFHLNIHSTYMLE